MKIDLQLKVHLKQNPELRSLLLSRLNAHRSAALYKKVIKDLRRLRKNLFSYTSHELVESELNSLIANLIPWRTGPFDIGNTHIDSEWRGETKWHQLLPELKDLQGKTILDVGSGNGYFSFRLSELNPSRILAIDPIDRCWLQFSLVNSFFKRKELSFLPLGILELPILKMQFDFVLCMGVIYHQRDPLKAVECLKRAIKPGGRLLLESLAVPGPEPLAPEGRYAKMRNAWIIPSAESMVAWLESHDFREVRIAGSYPITPEEQRRTPFAPYESLVDFLDPHDPSKTVEGYPAPQRVIVVGEYHG